MMMIMTTGNRHALDFRFQISDFRFSSMRRVQGWSENKIRKKFIASSGAALQAINFLLKKQNHLNLNLPT